MAETAAKIKKAFDEELAKQPKKTAEQQAASDAEWASIEANMGDAARKYASEGGGLNAGYETQRDYELQRQGVQNNGQNNSQNFTNAQQATTADDVNNQDARTRLWQSLNTAYSNQMEESDKAYDKSISQQNNAMLARGMGRSSYAAQISANMYNDKNTARNKLGQALIADYQNRIGEIEQQEQENEWRQKQFNYQKERDAVADTQWNQQFEYQKGRDKTADDQWQKQYDEQLRQFNENMKYQRERANVSDAQWQKTYDENLRQFNEQMKTNKEQFYANLGFQQSEAARQQSNWEIQQAFTEKQWKAQQDQWKQEFDYNKMSTEQKLNYETVMYALQNGKDVSDDMLKKAGISRADYNSMKAQAGGTASGAPAWKKAGFTSEEEYKKALASGYPTKAEYDKGMYDAVYGNGTGNRYADQIATIAGYAAGTVDNKKDNANKVYSSVFKKNG